MFVDEAGIVAPDSERRLEGLLSALLEEGGIELVGLTVPSLSSEPIDRFANRRLEEWRIGEASGGRGMLLVVAVEERMVRLEVSYELEGLLPDAFVGYLERAQMAPYFADGHVGPGVEAAVELIVNRVLAEIGAPDQATALLSGKGDHLGGGAGAAIPVQFEGGSERPEPDPTLRQRFGPQPTPRHAWKAFLETNRRRIKDPDLGLYDEAARERMRGTVTDAGQDHVARLYAGREPVVRREGDRAVILFPDDPDHRLAPWFFHRTTEGWRLDGAVVPEVVAYNHRNQWRFRRRDHPYMFAFHDFRFDEHGFAFHRPEP
ncbi:MAG TPA: TPM domain-containing protein [Thermoanaerobaculia bacterium]|nr:TPM domain-containing protein [Thermoanaerobaculia bacterium]